MVFLFHIELFFVECSLLLHLRFGPFVGHLLLGGELLDLAAAFVFTHEFGFLFGVLLGRFDAFLLLVSGLFEDPLGLLVDLGERRIDFALELPFPLLGEPFVFYHEIADLRNRPFGRFGLCFEISDLPAEIPDPVGRRPDLLAALLELPFL